MFVWNSKIFLFLNLKFCYFLPTSPLLLLGNSWAKQRRTAMKARQINNVDTGSEELNDSQENTSKASLTTKLERRRRIEDLDDEKRLREELSEF